MFKASSHRVRILIPQHLNKPTLRLNWKGGDNYGVRRAIVDRSLLNLLVSDKNYRGAAYFI